MRKKNKKCKKIHFCESMIALQKIFKKIKLSSDNTSNYSEETLDCLSNSAE